MGCIESKDKGSDKPKKEKESGKEVKKMSQKNKKGSSRDKKEREKGPGMIGISDCEGDFLEKYKLGRELGKGGFSIVYQCTSNANGEDYAVKVIDKEALKDDIKLLQREVSIMKKVNHPNILKLHEIYEDETRVFIVMELVDGSELFDRIVDKGFYSEKYSRNIIKQILSAVAYLHSQGIAHRDLKPENLLCSGEGEDEVVKIADFGLSKIFNEEDKLVTSCGTPGYVAPEVLLCESYDKGVDMWGIGIITYVLLAGYPPFYADEDAAMFERIMSCDYDFDDECWDDVSELAKDFIQKLLVKEPEKRLNAEEALEHPWLTSDSTSDKPLKIGDKFQEYNTRRKEEQVVMEPNHLIALK